MGMFKRFSLQFARPEGYLGRVAGKLMASTGVKNNEWTISLLQIKRSDYVLEIGFGPGVAIDLVSNLIPNGKYAGIDYSDVMLQAAKKRNKQAIQEQRVKLQLADVNQFPTFHQKFDKVFSVNSIIFWKEPIESLKKIRQVMKPNGLIALTVLPYTKGATEETSKEIGIEISHFLTAAGFSQIQIEFKDIKHVPSVCVTGMNIG